MTRNSEWTSSSSFSIHGMSLQPVVVLAADVVVVYQLSQWAEARAVDGWRQERG
jgi:hypothetical protein